MKWQTIVRRVADSDSAPAAASGVLTVLKAEATGSTIAQSTTDLEGLAGYVIDGNPGPTKLETQAGDVVRYQTSRVLGPDGPANIGEMRFALNAIAGTTGAGIVPGYGMQLAVSPTAIANTVSVESGQAIIPGGFVYTQYGTQTVTFASSNRTNAIVAEADSDETSATYGRTRLAVVTGEIGRGPVIIGARTLIAYVRNSTTAPIIPATSINQSIADRALKSFRQSYPVNTVAGSNTTIPVGSATYAAPVYAYGWLSTMTTGVTYDVEATGMFVVTLPSGSSYTEYIVIEVLDGNTVLATATVSYRFANLGIPQAITARVAWSGEAPNPLVGIRLTTYPQTGATTTVHSYSIQATAIPRR